MTALSFVWVHPYSQISGCDISTLDIDVAVELGTRSLIFSTAVRSRQRCLTNHYP